MDKNLSRFDKVISELSIRSENLQGRKLETEARIEALQNAEIPEIQGRIKAAYANGDDLISLDRRRVELRDELELSRLGLAGIIEELEACENRLSESIEARNSQFSTLAQGWLKKESQSFNTLVTKIQETAQRLFAVQLMLDESGDRETFTRSLGEGSRYLAEIKLISLGNGFTRTDLLPDEQRRRLRPDRDLCKEVFQEVTK